MTQLVTSSPGISFPTLVDDALTQAGVSPTVRTVTADMVSYISSGGKQAPQIALPRGQLSAAQLMILLEKLMGVSGDALLATMKTQVDTLEHATRSQLQEHLKKFNEMLAQQAKERASRSRGGVLGWIQKVTTLIVSVVVVAAIVAPIIAGTGGVGAVPVIMALMAMWSAGGALADIAMTAKSGKSLGEAMGSDWGAALATGDFGALSAIAVREMGGGLEGQIPVAIFVTLAMGFMQCKLGAAAQAGTMKILARMADTSRRVDTVTSGVTSVGQGGETVTQAHINKWISELQADLLNDQAEATVNQEMTEKTLEVVRAVQEGLTKFFEDAAESVSREFQGLGALLDTPSRRHAVA